MNFVEHFLSWLVFSICFLTMIISGLNKKQVIILLIIFGGLGFGMGNHLFQDAWSYDHQDFQDFIIDGKEREPMTFNEMFCMVRKNSYSYCILNESRNFNSGLE